MFIVQEIEMMVSNRRDGSFTAARKMELFTLQAKFVLVFNHCGSCEHFLDVILFP